MRPRGGNRVLSVAQSSAAASMASDPLITALRKRRPQWTDLTVRYFAATLADAGFAALDELGHARVGDFHGPARPRRPEVAPAMSPQASCLETSEPRLRI